jgi:kynurenine formamidase
MAAVGFWGFETFGSILAMTKEAVHHLLDRGVKVMGIDEIGFDPPVAKMF